MDRLPDHSPNQAEAKKPAAFLSQEGTDGPVRGAHSVPFMTLLQPHFPVTTERLRIATLSEEERDQAYEWLVGTHLGDSLEIPRNLTSAQFRWILVQAKDFSLFHLAGKEHWPLDWNVRGLDSKAPRRTGPPSCMAYCRLIGGEDTPWRRPFA